MQRIVRHQREDLLDPEKGAVWGSLVSGVAAGLAADIMSGGLSFGGGVLAGAILGALGGAGLARGFQLIKGGRLPEVSWTAPFLEHLSAQIVLRYLAVAHFGRGRGEFRYHDAGQRWRSLVGAALGRRREAWKAAFESAGEGNPAELSRVLDDTLRAILAERYPASARLLDANSPAAE